jgi:DNA-binding NarL/FixJ family response regulator
MRYVLLVEDHACFRQCLGRMLSLETDFGASTQAGSLAEARACLSDGKAEGIDTLVRASASFERLARGSWIGRSSRGT